MATNVIFTRGNTATINATAITDGQILYNTTAGTQYLDNGTTRIQVGQNITVDTTLNSLSNNPIANRGVAGVMMSSLSEISTVTQAGSLPDALAVKELNSNLGSLSFAQSTDGKWGYKVAGADPVIPFKTYEGYTLPTLYLLSSYTSLSPFTPVGSQASIPLTEAKGISLTYVAQPYNDITATLVDNNGNTTPAFSHTGRGGYSGSYTNNSLDKNYKWLSISVSANGESTNTATVSDIHVKT